MKTKVTSDNSVEGVPSQTTAVSTIANTAQSSVWSICDISTDSHVDLRDITPSISPVFTDDQVHELTRNPAEVDVLSEHFLPPDTFKRIDEVLSSGGETNLLYSDPVLSDTLKQNHDVLLSGDLGFHGSMFPSFDSIVEADRILNKRDDSLQDASNTDVATSDSVNWPKDGASLANATGNPGEEDQEDGKEPGADKGLRRSPRKRVQVKKDSDTPKTGNLASKSISRGKDISKLKYANAKPETEKKEVRRSGRAQKKVEKEESTADKKTKSAAVNSKKETSKDEEADGKDSLLQEDSKAQNVRRSPRTQRKAPVEAKQRGSRRQRVKEAEDSDDSKTENSTASDEKESVEKELDDTENKSTKSNDKARKETKKTSAEETENSQEEKTEVRKSGRLTRNRGKQTKDEEEKVNNEKNKTKAKENKEQEEEMEGKTEQRKNDSDVESNKEEEDKNISKKSSSVHKKDTDEALSKPDKGSDGEEMAPRRKKTQTTKLESSEDDETETPKRTSRRREERKAKENVNESVEDKTEKGTKPVVSAKTNECGQSMEKAVVKELDAEVEEGMKKSSKESERIKKAVGKDTPEDSDKKEKKSIEKDSKLSKEEEEEDEGDSDAESVGHDEEFNDDSDYDPEYDPDRLWCVCRKPHGNRFMICCDHCEEWFHGICVGITMAQGRQMEKNGQDYVCPKCKAKLEEESKKETNATAEKETEKVTSTSHHEKDKEEKPSPTPESRHRKERSLKMKLPGEREEKRKRRHSSHRRSREEIDEDFSSKRSKESERSHFHVHTKEEKKKKIPEHKGFKIPKKVRTTPTPASYMSHHAQPKCITTGCSLFAERHSLYCSPDCIQRHAEESLKILTEERNKRMGSKSSVSSSKSVTSPTSSLLGPVPWNSYSAPVSSQAESALPKEGVAVIERSTGRVIAGVAAPTQEELVYWLQDHPTFEVLRPTGKDEKKKEKKEDSEKAVRDNIRKSLKEILTTRSKDQQDLTISEEDVDKCSLNVEGEMFSFFGDTGHRYKNKYRSLMFNLKDPRNKVLFRHVLSGEITVDRLVRMTPEQLASPELATWREQETKHSLEMIRMNQEEINATKAHIKKTHKGEVEIDDDDLSTLENSVKNIAELKVENDLPDSNTSSSTLLLDTTEEHRIHLFDLNCRICTGKMAPPGEPPRRETPTPLVSTTAIVQAVAESSIPSPTPMDIVTSASSPDSATVIQPPVSPSVLSKTPKKVPAVWKGFVMMQSVAKFGTSAYRVSGSCDDLLQLLPDTLHVQGRIAHEQVWDYLLQLKSSTSREVCVIRYEASSDDEKLSYVSLYSYFYSRKRCGVVSNCYTGVKDMYLVPLASHQPIPPELLPFDGPGLDEPRPHMLLGVIVRAKPVFKRPRALSQRSLSPPPKRRTSSASIETSSSEGGTVESPASSKRSVLSELQDSPPADIDDIVFQYNTTQAKIASKEAKESSAKASPASETSTPSVVSSSAAGNSPAVSSDKVSVSSLEAQKQQLLDLQERARQYILAQTQRKGTASENSESEGASENKPESQGTVTEELKGGDGKGSDDGDAPYDPEEEFDLDLKPTEPTPVKPAVTVTSEQPAKPSSFEMLVSTLQRLQSAAAKTANPQGPTLSTVLPVGSTAVNSETSAVVTASTASQPTVSAPYGIQSVASTSSILQPIVPVSRDLQSGSSPHVASQPTGYNRSSSTGGDQPMPFARSGHLQHAGAVDQQPVSADRRIAQPSGTGDRHAVSADRHGPHLQAVADRQPVSADRHMPGATDRQTMSAVGRVSQPSGVPGRDPVLAPAGRQTAFAVGHGAQHPGVADRHPVSTSSTGQHGVSTSGSSQSPVSSIHGPHFPNNSNQSFQSRPPPDQRHQPVPQDSGHANRWNPSEPPQVTRHVNNVTQRTTQQYSGLRPEERARLAAHESRMEARENKGAPSEHRGERYEQRRTDDRNRGGWYDETRRHGDPGESRFPRDSRTVDSRDDWRHQHRPGRQWYDDEQRRDRRDYPLEERPRYEERRDERRFKEHWNRDRWRR